MLIIQHFQKRIYLNKLVIQITGGLLKIKITDEMGNDDEKNIQIEKITVNDLLKQLDIDPFQAIVMRKGEIILESEILSNEDQIKIINVIYGG